MVSRHQNDEVNIMRLLMREEPRGRAYAVCSWENKTDKMEIHSIYKTEAAAKTKVIRVLERDTENKYSLVTALKFRLKGDPEDVLFRMMRV